MIDNPDEVNELMREMEACLPIPARPSSRLERHMRHEGVQLPGQLNIKAIFYHGDEGGISCDVTVPDSPNAVIVSITHLWISASHPLGTKIRAYQENRRRRLRLEG